MKEFSESIRYGEYGEHTIWNLLNKMEHTRSVVDVRKDKNFQEQDIDFLVEDFDRQFTPVEVKTDYKAQVTGNLVYELSTSGNIGCFEKTQARYIIYYLPRIETAYFVEVSKLREFVKTTKPKKINMGDYSKGYLLSIKDLTDSKVIVDTITDVK